MQTTRLNKFISESGLCSRREADRFIEQGVVTINSRRAKLGDVVAPRDVVKVHGNLVEAREVEARILIALNKPVGVVCTTELDEPDNIISFIGHPRRIFPIGRLDKDSQGLILLTSDGDMVNKILRVGNAHQKQYTVTVQTPISDKSLEIMRNGVPMLGVTTKKCEIERVSQNVFSIRLTQGLNRQIRRMVSYVGNEVIKLERTQIMHISLKGLELGQWRDVTDKELAILEAALAKSSNTAATGAKKPRRRRFDSVPGPESSGNSHRASRPKASRSSATKRRPKAAQSSGRRATKPARKSSRPKR